MRAGGCVVDPSIIHVAELAVDIAADADTLEQGVSRRFAERATMLEDNQLAACHLAARRRVVVLEHAGERGEQKSRSSSPNPVRSASLAEMKPWAR